MHYLRRVDRDLPALTVLALLRTGPRHTYEMHRLMIDTHKDFVTGLPRSVYHAVERLLRDELVGVHEVRRDGARPERTIYAVTPAGRAALADRVGRLLAVPDPDTSLFVAALSFIACLPRDRAVAALRARATELAARVAALDAALATVPASLPRLLLVESGYERSRWEAERSWVEGLVADVESGRLDWADIEALIALAPAGEAATD